MNPLSLICYSTMFSEFAFFFATSWVFGYIHLPAILMFQLSTGMIRKGKAEEPLVPSWLLQTLCICKCVKPWVVTDTASLVVAQILLHQDPVHMCYRLIMSMNFLQQYTVETRKVNNWFTSFSVGFYFSIYWDCDEIFIGRQTDRWIPDTKRLKVPNANKKRSCKCTEIPRDL